MHCCKFAGCKLQVQCCRFGVELSRSSPGAAFLAKSGISIPAAIRANPLAAPAASAEKGLCLFDRPLAGSVMSLAPNRALGLAAAAGAGQNAANYIARCSQQVSRCSTAPRLKSGHVSVSAFVAIEFELISAIGREILMIGGKVDKPHSARMLLVCKSELFLPEEKKK
jgi:hypothetical protein